MVSGPRRLPSDWLGPEPPDNVQSPGYEAEKRVLKKFLMFCGCVLLVLIRSVTEPQRHMNMSVWYLSSLQNVGSFQTLVDEQRLQLLVAIGDGLHLGVDGVQIPAEGVTLQPSPQLHPLADVTKAALA